MSEIKKSVLFDSNSVVVVLDTNQLYDNFFMDTPRFQLMLKSMETLNYKLIIPQIVFDEVVYKYKEKLEETVIAFNKQAKKLNRLILDKRLSDLDEFDAVKHERAYRSYLLRKIRKFGRLLPYPNISHEILTKKAISKTKPFNQHGAGYRDALIWESVRTLANIDNKNVVFITSNSADFSEGKGDENHRLHDQLLEEINKKEKVVYFTNIEAFNKDFLAEHLVRFNNLDDQFGRTVENWLNTNIFPIIKNNEDWGHLSTGLPHHVCSYFLRNCEIISKASIIEAYSTDMAHAFLKIKTNLIIDALVNVDYDDYQYNYEVRDWLGFKIDPNDYISIDHHDQIEITFDMIINTLNMEVEKSELVRMENDYNQIEY